MSKAAPAAKDDKKLAPPAAAKKPESKSSSEASSSDEDEDESDEDTDDEMARLEKLNLSKDQIILLKNAFTAFDKDKKGCLGLDMIGTILELLGHAQTQAELQTIIKEVDTDGSGELEFEEFCHLASKFLVEEEDESQVNAELLHWELKEAFRLYDRQGLGYITTTDFKEILKELDPDIPEKDLIGIVNEVDDDDSGTVDFEEFYKALR